MTKTIKQRDSVVLYRSFYESIKELQAEQQVEIYNAIFEFSLNGIEPQMSGIAKAIFTLIKPQIIANNARYSNSLKGGKQSKNELDNDENNENFDENNEPNSNLAETETEPSSKKTEPSLENSEPRLNLDLTKPEPRLNLDLTKSEPKLNLDLTETQPNSNLTQTKPKPNENVNVNDNVNVKDIRTEIEYILSDKTRARARIHSHIFEDLDGGWLRQHLSGNEQFQDRVLVFDRYVEILEGADTQSKIEAVLLLDSVKFCGIFNALYQGVEEIEDTYRYVWKAVLDNARRLKNKKR